jgi:ubiquinone/menaquinone biosynthesis C-methylase UbiE
MLKKAKEKAERLGREKISLSIMDAQKLSYNSNSFDFVFAASVLSAVEDPEKTMREMVRVTKKGGQIAVIVNIRDNSSLKSQIIKKFDPFTKKYLGFRTDMDETFFLPFKNIRPIEHEQINTIFHFPLSQYMLFEKI